MNNELHKISKEIVEEAEKHNAIIAIGDLKGIRNKSNKGRKANRKISSMPSHKLKEYIRYRRQLTQGNKRNAKPLEKQIRLTIFCESA